MKLRFGEFVALIAVLMSCQALAVDAMLPALGAIVSDLGIVDANRAQWVISVYVAGVGAGQLFWGILSDRYGRRPVLMAGLVISILPVLAMFLAMQRHFIGGLTQGAVK